MAAAALICAPPNCVTRKSSRTETDAWSAAAAPALAARAAICFAGRGTALIRRLVAQRADAFDDRLERRAGGLVVRVERLAHGGKVAERGAATAADDLRATIHRQPHIVGHQFRRAG